MQTYVLGIDVGTGGTRALIMGGDGRVLAPARMGRAAPGRLVASRGNRNPQSTCQGAVARRADFLCRVFRTNARGGDAGRQRRRGSAGADLVRRADGETMLRADRAPWRRAVDPSDLQSGPGQFHDHKIVMDTRERTGKLETSTFGLASEGLRSIPADRRKSHGCRRCFRDPPAECSPAAVVGRSSAGGRIQSVVAAGAL